MAGGQGFSVTALMGILMVVGIAVSNGILLVDHARVRLLAHLALFAGDRQHGKLQMPVGAGSDLLHSNHIAGRHPVLLPTGADNRVHTSSTRNVVEIQPVLRISWNSFTVPKGAHGRWLGAC